MAPPKSQAAPNAYRQVSRVEVPHGRNGKHKGVVTHIISDLSTLKMGLALKIALDDLPDTKENIRSALNRATRKAGMTVATARRMRSFFTSGTRMLKK
jgi:hypothetical protein